MKNVVIAGSAKLQDKISHWVNYWKNKNHNILDYPVPIEEENFLKEYPDVHRDFFKNITETDVLFIMNEDKNGIIGYIGAESFAEMCFAVVQNLLYGKSINIILLKMPENKVQSYDEVVLWLKLGWIKLLEE